MAQVSMLDTSQNPTQSNCQQYIRTDSTAHYVGPKVKALNWDPDMIEYKEHI